MAKSSPWASLLPPLGAVLGVVLAGMAVLLWLGRDQAGAGTDDLGRLMAAVQASRAEARAALAGDGASFALLGARGAEIEELRRRLSSAADAAPDAREFAAGSAEWPTVIATLDELDGAQAALADFHGARASLLEALAALRRSAAQSVGRPDSAEGQANRGAWEQIELRVQRMEQDARSLAAPADVEAATTRLGADEQSLRRSLGALASPGATAALDAARAEIDAMSSVTPRVAAAAVAARALDGAGASLMRGFENLDLSAPTLGGAVVARQLPLVLAGTSVVILLLIALAYYKARDFRRAAAIQAEQNQQNQQAILRLLDELSSLADGDLTVQATVTEDITGAIADSINYAIEALRELVATVNESAILVDGAAQQSKSVVTQLVRSSETQAKQVRAATEAIAKMIASAEQVSGNAERCSDVARHSVAIAHKGGEAVRRTIEGMNTIRETIQDTSKRIKRLGESSQEIGNIVELIDEIAEQTNILALNASIEASRAGEASRGFAVVADEVQKLAERSSNATRKIEVLVSTIQSDTNEAVVSMERSTTDVVGGALLAENAGAALDEIEQVSHQIASLVQNISTSAGEQGNISEALKKNMLVLREISGNTKDATAATSSAISKLSELAAQQRRTVSGFTLPEDMAGSGIFTGENLSLGIKPKARKAQTSEAATPPAAVERRQSG